MIVNYWIVLFLWSKFGCFRALWVIGMGLLFIMVRLCIVGVYYVLLLWCNYGFLVLQVQYNHDAWEGDSHE